MIVDGRRCSDYAERRISMRLRNARYSAESDAPEGRWGWPAPAGGAGLWEVDGRYLRGTPQVEHGQS